MTGYVRAFVAVELPSHVREALAGLVEGLRSARLSGLRLVNPEGVHLTLKFLGDILPTRIEEIVAALSRVAQRSCILDLELGDTGGFPNLRAPRVMWVGLRGDTEALLSLQQGVEEALEGLGFPKERRPFSPHLTLARIWEGASQQERRRAGEALGQVALPQGLRMQVETLSLMQSTLLPSGAVYSRLGAVSLGRKMPDEPPR